MRLVIVAAAAAMLAGCDQPAHGPDAVPIVTRQAGMWQTTTQFLGGTTPIPASIPPEMRDQYRAQMAQEQTEHQEPPSAPVCIDGGQIFAEELTNRAPFGAPGFALDGCTVTQQSQDRSSFSRTTMCTKDNHDATLEIHGDVSPTSVVTTYHFHIVDKADPSQLIDSRIQTTERRVGDCLK